MTTVLILCSRTTASFAHKTCTHTIIEPSRFSTAKHQYDDTPIRYWIQSQSHRYRQKFKISVPHRERHAQIPTRLVEQQGHHMDMITNLFVLALALLWTEKLDVLLAHADLHPLKKILPATMKAIIQRAHFAFLIVHVCRVECYQWLVLPSFPWKPANLYTVLGNRWIQYRDKHGHGNSLSNHPSSLCLQEKYMYIIGSGKIEDQTETMSRFNLYNSHNKQVK